ncbi:MAG: hypothetical protein Q9201_004988 [Fulgogasparrea decipioides]
MPSADSPDDSLTSPALSALPSTSKPFSISLASSKAKPSNRSNTTPSSHSKPLNPRKRPHSSLNDDSDSDTEDRAQRAPQPVSAFDHSAGGAISVDDGNEKTKKEPLVIQGLKNRDWREESRRKRGKNLLPAEVQAERAGQRNGVHGDVHGDSERDEVRKDGGLQFVGNEKDGEGDVSMVEELVTAQVDHGRQEKVKTVDEEALEALMGDGTRKSTLVVPAIRASEKADEEAMENGRVGMNEDDHFRFDVASRPDSASLDDYARVPVEEFGLGMLRGMGWKEGEVVGKRKDQVSRARVVERRPALLGIGAKEVPGGVGDELGAWGKVARGKKKEDKTYNPVVLKNSKTGEMLTAEELQAKKAKQMDEEREWRERRDRNLAVDEERKSERKKRDEERGYEGASSKSGRRERSRSRDSRHSSSRRERSRSSDRRHRSSRRDRSSSRDRRHHSKRRDYDDDDRREKERRRERHYDRDVAKSSRHREEYDDTRRRRHEVY